GPVQSSATSQEPPAARHSVELGLKGSAGQSLVTPSQVSATSQSPAARRQTAVLFASAGQLAPLPVQNSATSQIPAAARHSIVLGSKVSAGQSFEVPSQLVYDGARLAPSWHLRPSRVPDQPQAAPDRRRRRARPAWISDP